MLLALLVFAELAALGAAIWYDTRRVNGDPMSRPDAYPVQLTEYWPASASEQERRMEGGLYDRRGALLYSVQDYDERSAPYVSLAGDDVRWPYGQRVQIDALGDRICRVVDTGGNFSSRKNKKIRVAGREPIDVCVDHRGTISTGGASLVIIEGDSFENKPVRTDGWAERI